jgi:hypothetical protein
VEGRRPRGRRGRWLLLPGHQQGRAAPGRGPALAGVPLLRRGTEPLPRRWSPSGPCRRHGPGRLDQQG